MQQATGLEIYKRKEIHLIFLWSCYFLSWVEIQIGYIVIVSVMNSVRIKECVAHPQPTTGCKNKNICLSLAEIETQEGMHWP